MASVNATVHIRINPDDRKTLAALMLIRNLAESIAHEQPWNDDAKAIKRLAKRVLKRAVKIGGEGG